MEQDGLSLVCYVPPHGQPGQHEHSSEWTPDDLRGDTSSQECDDSLEGDSLEDAAVELYTGILLGRAHLLLFNSIRIDVGTRDNLFDRGKEVLEEAISLCFSGQYSVSKAVLAKCWYIRGFLADVSGDDENAGRCFAQATNLDASYGNLQRVRWHLLRREDLDQLFEAWHHPQEPREKQTDEHRPGERDADHDVPATTSSPSVTTPDYRQSELYQFLLSDINKTNRTEDKPVRGVPSPVFSPQQPHHLPPVATPHNDPFTDRVDQLVQEKINGPGAERRASQETREALKGSENSPVRDLFLRRVEDRQRKARLDAERRMRQIREARTRQSAVHSRRLSGQEALLSDALGIAELDTTTTSAEDDGSPCRKLTINTRGARRSSISSKSSDSSPVLPSPLRKASLPGDAQAAADGRPN